MNRWCMPPARPSSRARCGPGMPSPPCARSAPRSRSTPTPRTKRLRIWSVKACSRCVRAPAPWWHSRPAPPPPSAPGCWTTNSSGWWSRRASWGLKSTTSSALSQRTGAGSIPPETPARMKQRRELARNERSDPHYRTHQEVPPHPRAEGHRPGRAPGGRLRPHRPQRSREDHHHQDPDPIRITGLTRKFRRTPVLKGIDLAVPREAVFALIGPNGAGKTTTIKILMNILRPTSGCAEILSIDSRRLAGRDFTRIGYVSENQEMPDWMTVDYFMRYLRPFYPAWDDDLAAELVRRFNLPGDRKLKHLSRGMRMKAALASSLAYRPVVTAFPGPLPGAAPRPPDAGTPRRASAAAGGPGRFRPSPGPTRWSWRRLPRPRTQAIAFGPVSERR